MPSSWEASPPDWTRRRTDRWRKSRTESSLAEGLTYPKASWSFENIAIQVAIFEGMGAIYIPFFQMKILHRAKG
jgi:hypothetical protein